MNTANALEAECRPRIVGVLEGDIVGTPAARTKYGLLFAAVAQRFPLVEVYNAALQGGDRLLNALQALHPNRRQWQERFYQNVPAFRLRSRRTVDHLRALQGHTDLVLQIGCLFDARWDDAPLPSVIYTDYTMRLAARRPSAGRAPLTPRQLDTWLDLERTAYARALHICTRGSFVRDSLIRDYGIAAERVTAIGGGVNLPTLPDALPRRAGPPTALFVGVDFHRKGGDLLLHAFARVHERLPEARLFVVTGEAIPAALPRAGVTLLPPTWDRAALGELYAAADVFVLPSRLETWGDVLLEAMAYGLPCVGVAGEAMDEIIQDGQTGLVVPPGNIERLAAALLRLLQNDAERHAMGAAARQRVAAYYTWPQVVERLAGVLERAALPV